MGNQGMTNWKFSAFFAIALMLIAGLFTNAAIAGLGDGAVELEVATTTVGVVGVHTAESPIPAASTTNTLEYTYTAFTVDDQDVQTAIDMSGHAVQITIPNGWTVPKNMITVTDGTTVLFLKGATDEEDAVTTGVITTSPVDVDVDDLLDQRRVSVTGGDNLTGGDTITVDLNSLWGTGDTRVVGRELTISFAGVTAHAPPRLTYPRTGDLAVQGIPTATYAFTVRTGKDGAFRRLKPSTGDDEPQPTVYVGNVQDGVGEVTIYVNGKTGENVYETEKDIEYRIVFKALGPMYDVDRTSNDIETSIVITIPGDLTAPQAGVSGDPGYVQYSGRTGGVVYENPNNPITVDTSARTITINIERVDTGATITVLFRKVVVDDTVETGVDDQKFSVETLSLSTSTALRDVKLVETDITSGQVHGIAGSGKMEVDRDAVAVGGKQTFTFTYTAATALAGVDLIMTVPDSGEAASTGAWGGTETGTPSLVTGEANRLADNYVYYSKKPTMPTGDAPVLAGTDDVIETITVAGLELGKGKSFSIRINKLQVPMNAADADIYSWTTTLDDEEITPPDIPEIYVVRESNTDDPTAAAAAAVMFEIVNPDFTSNGGSPVSFPRYHAASKQSIRFKFTPSGTPIKDGSFWFDIPSDWARTSTTDVDGRATVDLIVVSTATTPADEGMAAADEKIGDDIITLTASGTRITVKIVKLDRGPDHSITIQYGRTGDDDKYQGQVGPTANANLEIIGRFNSGVSGSRGHPAGIAAVVIDNAKDGSGTAMISARPGGRSVKAGSDDNSITVTYEADGTMDDGRVSLEIAPDWGALQLDKTEDNFISVNAPSRYVDPDEIDYGDRFVVVNLKEFGKGHSVQFIISNAKAQRNLGIAAFTIKSAGSSSGSLEPVLGEPRPSKTAGSDDKETDPFELLGQVYQQADGLADGMLRLEVTTGDGGTGDPGFTITQSDAGLLNYLNDDGEAVPMRQVHAGDTAINIEFTYKPTETIEDGELQFVVDSDWSKPQEDSSSLEGYTRVTGAGVPTFDNWTATIPIAYAQSGDTITINYGTDGGVSKAPTARETSVFRFIVDGKPIEPIEVTVRSQASGRGSVSVDPMEVNAGADGSITITYTPIGDVYGGRVKLTVPVNDAWGGDDGVTGEFVASTSGQKNGGSLTETQLTEYGITKNEVLVTNINLSYGSTLTFTYTGTMPVAKGDLAFSIDLDGGEGPGEVEEGTPDLADVGDVTVMVIDAAAGSGMVSAMATGDVVQANMPGNEITVTYTAIGEIGGDKEITVTVPDGWSPPLNDTAADEKMGTFTVMHLLKLADDAAADAEPEDGGAVDVSVMKAEDAAGDDDAEPMIMVATVVDGEKLAAGDSVVFTYINATAAMTLGDSRFTTTYDDAEVDGEDTILVVSASPATALSLTSDAMNGKFYIDGGLTVTVMLQDGTGEAATRDAATTVTLGDGDAGGSFDPMSITIAMGVTTGTSAYTPADAGDVTITASADLGGDADVTEEIMVTADTMSPMVDGASISVTPAIAKTDTVVTVSAMATPNRADGTVLFSIGEIITEGQMTEDEAGSYSGMTVPLTTLHVNGVHSVIVSIMDGSEVLATATAVDALTIDHTPPTVEASDVEGTVANGEMVTITATVSDADSGIASVTADVSMLDTAADPAEVMLTDDDDDGTYTYSHTISENTVNEADNGTHVVAVTATDAAGNEATAEVMVTLKNTISFTSMIPTGANLFHVPLNDPDITTVGDLRKELGDAVSSLIVRHDGGWEPDSDGVMVTSDLGIYLVATAEITHTFEGDAWEDTTLSLEVGQNLVGLPVNDPGVAMVSDIIGLFDEGVIVGGVTIGSGSEYTQISGSDDSDDTAVQGHAAYYIVTSAADSADLMGDGWENGDTANAAPIALSGYRIENQAPALAVYGSVLDELTGVAREGFRVKVKNLSTKAALSEITSVEAADGYSMAFVDLTDARAARVGDVLEISADSPNPLIGVKLVRHIVTVDDVKNGRITLEDLIAYEIPAETELLRNYPNPFNPETWIPYRLAEDADVSLTIYDAYGSLVRSIDIGHQIAAVYDTRAKAIYWDGRNQFGEQVASGLYFYHLSAGDFSGTRRMVILK